MIEMIVGAVVFGCGVLLGSRLNRKTERIEGVAEEVVKRHVPSFKNPLKTYNTLYDKYKGQKSGLYEPVIPKRTDTNNEVESK